jgi:hypothetical protein
MRLKPNAVACDGVRHGEERLGIRDGKRRGLARRARARRPGFNIGKFPETGVDAALGTLADKVMAILLDNERDKPPTRGRDAPDWRRDFVDTIGF